jgi:hypothetical protein
MARPGRPHRVAAAATTAAVVAVLAAGCSSGPAKPTSPGPASPGPASPGPASPGPASPEQAAASRSAAAGLAVGAQRTALAARYLAIAQAGNKRLEVEFDRLHKEDRMRLATAHRDLREIAATERLFDRRLLGIQFPAATERIAQFLYWVNEQRARLTAAAALSPSPARLRADQRRLTEANKPVEQAVAILRSQLGLPPPETS